jgi:CheY-like chemotaxis protein
VQTARVDARVLVVEDLPAIRRFAVEALELCGCATVGVESLAEALEVAALSAPDVLVVEERVMRAAPETFRAVRESDPLRNTRIVALGFLKSRRELIEMGADCVVGKPFTDRELVVGVEWVLGVYSAAAELGPRPRGPTSS